MNITIGRRVSVWMLPYYWLVILCQWVWWLAIATVGIGTWLVITAFEAALYFSDLLARHRRNLER